MAFKRKISSYIKFFLHCRRQGIGTCECPGTWIHGACFERRLKNTRVRKHWRNRGSFSLTTANNTLFGKTILGAQLYFYCINFFTAFVCRRRFSYVVQDILPVIILPSWDHKISTSAYFEQWKLRRGLVSITRKTGVFWEFQFHPCAKWWWRCSELNILSQECTRFMVKALRRAGFNSNSLILSSHLVCQPWMLRNGCEIHLPKGLHGWMDA